MAVEPSNQWWALLAPAPLREPAGYLTTPHDAARVLAKQYTLRPVQLGPGERQMIEYVSLVAHGWSRLVYWPIIATGTLEGSWHESQRVVARLLHRACCLLSLAWGEPWQVRHAPNLIANSPPNVPDPVLVPAPAWFDDKDAAQIGLRDEEELPGWFDPAWDRLGEENAFAERMGPALSLWHEGILLQSEHPSMAMVAYVAAVEQAALSLPEAAPASGFGQRFWAAIRAVAEEGEIESLRQADIYGRRSATSHGSALYGIEMEFGYMLLQPVGPGDPAFDFVYGALQLMARVSRRCLLKVLDPAGQSEADP
jgi:hypothetical protein